MIASLFFKKYTKYHFSEITSIEALNFLKGKFREEHPKQKDLPVVDINE